jgi:hypothetical protein
MTIYKVHFVFIWYIFPVLVSCTKKNLATLPRCRSWKKINRHFCRFWCRIILSADVLSENISSTGAGFLSETVHHKLWKIDRFKDSKYVFATSDDLTCIALATRIKKNRPQTFRIQRRVLKKRSWGVALSSSAAWVVPFLRIFLNLVQTS